jgi:hypothetical protein
MTTKPRAARPLPVAAMLLLAAALAAAPAAAADPASYAALGRRIDAAMVNAKLGPEQASEVRRLREESEALQRQGKPGQATEKLAEAAQILGVKQQ